MPFHCGKFETFQRFQKSSLPPPISPLAPVSRDSGRARPHRNRPQTTLMPFHCGKFETFQRFQKSSLPPPISPLAPVSRDSGRARPHRNRPQTTLMPFHCGKFETFQRFQKSSPSPSPLSLSATCAPCGSIVLLLVAFGFRWSPRWLGWSEFARQHTLQCSLRRRRFRGRSRSRYQRRGSRLSHGRAWPRARCARLSSG